jgi:hypothetical protein
MAVAKSRLECTKLERSQVLIPCQSVRKFASLGVMWIVDAAERGAWREVNAYPGKPDHLAVRMRFAPTGDGVAVAGIQVDRTDGRALTARDLRQVKLPPNWVLFGETAVRWFQPGGDPAARHRRGPSGGDEARDRMVWDLYQQARKVAPRAPVRWMFPQLGVSDATARRWVKRAVARAAELGWPSAAADTAGNG